MNGAHAQWKGPKPPIALQSDGPYALSPRPGDSLSLPFAENPGLPQPATLKECAWDSLDQPYLVAKGEVTYAVTAEGVPDTATLIIRSYRGVDSSTFQAAARRIVANCRFHARVFAPDQSPGVVRQRLFFAAPNASEEIYTASGEVVVSRDTPADSAMASYLEDATMLSCPAVTGLPAGRVELQFVVGLDGKPEPATMRAVNATSPEFARLGLGIAARCRFKPAQFKGRPVRSLIILPLRVNPANSQGGED